MSDKPVLHARQIIESFDDMIRGIQKHSNIDFAALLGALHELTKRYEYERRLLWIEESEKRAKEQKEAK
ncbi:MAG TPA: hypothetical protein VMT67_01045 [Terriglobales bacterium]|nr:hypothetical protein [Terriglobales bacterium]